MHLLLSAEECEAFLLDELRRGWPGGSHLALGGQWVSTDAVLQADRPPCLVFARQVLPDAREETAASISAWSERLLAAVVSGLPEDQPWLLHVEPHFGTGTAGRNRCRLIVDSLREKLQRKHRGRLRSWRIEPEPFSTRHSLVQLVLTEPEHGWLSVATAPQPHCFRAVISPFSKGAIPIGSDKAAPSRAFTKLVEAELRLGRRIEAGETCVDLGASPGSWSYVALNRGARVLAVDRSPLRDDLMRHSKLTFHKGDAFSFVPDAPVDWLLCDVIAAPERSIELVLDWARLRRTRHFVVTIKFKGTDDYAVLEPLKQVLPPLCDEFFLTRLCANKNEACVFGTLRAQEGVPVPSST
jgi:23S rRNA (cytidine2498-2'-O)-methyltransferase